MYFRRAGDAANASFANETAIQHYERLLPLLTTQEQAEVRVQLGEVQAHTGQWVQAEAQLRAGLAATSLSLQARAQLALGRLLARSQSYADSIQWLQLARASFSELVDEPRLCNTLTHLSFAQLELGELPAAEDTAQQQWRIAQETQDVAGMAEAQQTLGQLCLQRGQLVEAQAHLGQALQLATAQEDPSRSLIIENDIATLAWRMNDYPMAFAHFISALGIADRIGFRAWVGVLLGNIGVLLWELGALDRAAQCQAWALKIALEVGDQSSELTCLGNIASLLRDMHSDLTRPILARAITLGQTLRMPYYLCDHACLATELAFEQGDFIEAEHYCTLAHEAAQIANDTEVLFRVRVWRGRIDGVQTLLNETITPEQAALVYDHIWQLSGLPNDAQRAIDAYAQLFTKTPRHSYKAHVERIASGAGLPVPMLHTPAWVAPLCATPLPELTLIEMDDVDLTQLLREVQGV